MPNRDQSRAIALLNARSTSIFNMSCCFLTYFETEFEKAAPFVDVKNIRLFVMLYFLNFSISCINMFFEKLTKFKSYVRHHKSVPLKSQHEYQYDGEKFQFHFENKIQIM